MSQRLKLRDWGTISSRPFSKYARSLEKMGTAKYPLHIGDTFLPPPNRAVMRPDNVPDYDAHKYCSPKGHPKLLNAISAVYNVDPNRVMVVPGATGGLHISAMATISAGDTVLILAPFWPLAKGIFQAVGATAICVPFFGEPGTVIERLQPYIDERTVGIYCNSPNNPTGLMLTINEAQELANLVTNHDLWLFSDEVYERLVYNGTHISLRSLAPKHTISLYSFSKAYAMAGYRCGYVILPDIDLADHFLKGVVHSIYSVSTPAQIVAAQVLLEEHIWLHDTCSVYATTGSQVADILGVQHPTNGTFIFMDISQHLQQRSFDEFMISCINHKLLLAPGSAFGDGYDSYIRVCFTSVKPETAIEGAHILRKILNQNA